MTTIPVPFGALRVSVTEQDIARGKRIDCRHCPVARALRRAGIEALRSVPDVTGAVTVEVDSLTLNLLTGGWVRYTATTPDRLRSFMGEYDRRQPVGPVTVDVDGWRALA